MYKCFGPWRASGYIYVHGNYMVGALYHRVGIVKKRTSACGTGTHGNYILGVGHLVVQPFQHRRHFVYNGTGYNNYIGLPGASPCYFKPKPAPVVLGRGGAHHFNGTATCTENQRPQAITPCPIDYIIHFAQQDATTRCGVNRSGKGHSSPTSPLLPAWEESL